MVTGLEPCDSPRCSLECPHICKTCTLTPHDLYVLHQVFV
nr:MAG TPA: Large T antigen, DNA polymerase initiation, Hydrolase-DNA binding complex [Caudoviricetes sp.]